MARPWKIGSVRIKAAPIIAAAAVNTIGLNRVAPASTSASRSETPPVGAAVADEVHQQDRIAHDNARQRDEADHRGRCERRAEQPMTEHDADQGQAVRAPG